MFKLFSKYIDFSAPQNVHLEAKINGCDSVDEVFKLLHNEKWIISEALVNTIKADVKETKKATADEKAKKEEKDKKAQEDKDAEDARILIEKAKSDLEVKTATEAAKKVKKAGENPM